MLVTADAGVDHALHTSTLTLQRFSSLLSSQVSFPVTTLHVAIVTITIT
jgi:hypothetical protein